MGIPGPPFPHIPHPLVTTTPSLSFSPPLNLPSNQSSTMKRAMDSESDLSNESQNPPNTKKPKLKSISNQDQDYDNEERNEHIRINDDLDCDSQFAKLDDNLLYEVFKHADAKTLALASCVSKQWYRTAQDERLWEMICTHHWSNSVNYGTQRLRSVVLALGGFRRLHALYLSKTAPVTPPLPPPPTSEAASSSSSSIPDRGARGGSKRWGKDEVNLSLSLLSIRFYEKMNSANKRQ